jgi:predicted HTH domain antitoxin
VELLGVQPRDLVEAGLFDSEEVVIETAIDSLLAQRPELRIPLAVHLYQRDEGWSLAGIAQFAGVSFERMKEILLSRGVELRLGPATIEEARQEVATMRQWFRDHAR